MNDNEFRSSGDNRASKNAHKQPIDIRQKPMQSSSLLSMPWEDPRGQVDGSRPFLSVIVPAYNEADSIIPTVHSIASSARKACDSHEIIVVDDGSDDATREKLRAVTADIPEMQFLSNDHNRGKGYAVRDGCKSAIGKYVLLMDADGDLRAERLASFVDRAQATGADIVIGSKRHPDSDVSYPLVRQVLSVGYSLLIRLLFGIQVTDTQVGMKLLRWEAVNDVMPLLLVERYAYDVELLALVHQQGYTIAEAPVSLEFNGDSSIDWGEVGRIGWDTLAVFCRLKLFRSYNKIERGISYAQERRPISREEQRR